MQGMNKQRIADCLVIGAGPAGLTAALYLRRFLRDVVVVDNGHSRAMAIETTHNFPGFPQGISGHALLQLLRTQLMDVQGEVVDAEVTALERLSDGRFAAQWGGTRLVSRTVLLATGVVDPTPALPGVEQVQQRGLLRQCPICDGYEHRDQRILVLGDGSHAEREAAFIGHFSPQVAHAGLTRVPAAQRGVRLLTAVASTIETPPEGGVRLHLAGGEVHNFDVAYAAVGVQPRSALGVALGATVDSLGSLVKDEEGATDVPGLYTAGDVACGLDQLVVAAAQGAVAATAIHNGL